MLRKTLHFLPIVLLALMEAALPAFGQPAAGTKVVGGPYVVNVRQRSATLVWVVQTGVAYLGTEPDKTDSAVPVLHAEKITLSGLKSGTTYHYVAFGGDAGKGSFKTAPIGPSDFQFVVYGDTRTRHEVHRGVINAILKSTNPDFVMHTGDLVEDGWNTAMWPIFFDVERELLRKAAFFPTLGNHERDARNYFDYMDASRYYSFDWGSAHFTVINSDIGNAGSIQIQKDAFWQEQTRWLEADLRDAQKADFRFLFAHHPPMTAVKRRQGNNQHMIALEPMFEKYKLSAGFFGHDHNYQHYLKNGIHYFITGGGGAPLYDVDAPPEGITKMVASTENFVSVRIAGKQARMEAMKPNGETLDVTELSAVSAARVLLPHRDK